jgi:hypothetical protein
MLGALEAVLVPGAPLSSCLRRRTIRRMVDAVRGGRPLPHRTYNFLWTILFTSGWLQAAAGATRKR